MKKNTINDKIRNCKCGKNVDFKHAKQTNWLFSQRAKKKREQEIIETLIKRHIRTTLHIHHAPQGYHTAKAQVHMLNVVRQLKNDTTEFRLSNNTSKITMMDETFQGQLRAFLKNNYSIDLATSRRFWNLGQFQTFPK